MSQSGLLSSQASAPGHEIPTAFLTNELIIELKDKAAKWFQTKFSDAADNSPQCAVLQSALLHNFTRRYTATSKCRPPQCPPPPRY